MSSTTKLDNVNATRMELISLRTRKKLAENGYDLLNKKLETLTNRLFSYLDSYREVQKKIQQALREASEALTKAEMAMGTLKVREISLSYSSSSPIEVRTDSLPVMGVKVPRIEVILPDQVDRRYTYADSSVRLDDAILKFQKALKISIELAEVQSTISRLATEIQSTKRRVNALKNIVIPRVDTTIRWIALTLGEQEREEFVRLKKVKAKLDAKEE